MTPKNCHLCHGKNKAKNILKSFSHTDYGSHIDYGHSYCDRCGISFDSNVNEILDEYEEIRNDDVTSLNEAQYRKYFVETSDITDDDDAVYTDFDWDNQDELKKGVANHVLKKLKSKYNSEDEFSVLDIGCGDGFTTIVLANSFPKAEFIAVDPSPQVKKVNRFENITAYQGILQNIGISNKKFDVIVIIGNLMLHADPFDTLKHAKALLKDDGVLVFDFKNINSSIRVLARVLGQLGIKFINNHYLIQRNFISMRYGLSRNYMENYCESIGLDVIESSSKPPRLLEFGNKSTFSSGAQGLFWRFFDKLDKSRDERAWVQFSCMNKLTDN